MLIKTIRTTACLLICLFLAACGNGGMNMYPYRDAAFTRDTFAVCHGFNCYYRTQGHITDKQWKNIEKLFKPAPKTAEEERVRIGKAIGLMETYAGLSSGLNKDRPEAETFEEDRITQMDCIDETVNTDLYLSFLHKEKLLTFHKQHEPVHRGYFIDGAWPHNSAAVKEIETGTVWVVDSYYGGHGKPAYVISLPEWADFWRAPGCRRCQKESNKTGTE